MTHRLIIVLFTIVCIATARFLGQPTSLTSILSGAGSIEHRARRSSASQYLGNLKKVGRKTLSEVVDGSKIVIQGMVAEDAKRINITLRNHKTKEDALVMSFRIDKETVSLNSFFGGGWDFPEWRRSLLRAGDEFIIEIFVGDDEYMIVINEFWTATYSHRIDYSILTHVILSGDAVVEKIEYVEPEDEEEEEEEEEEEDEEDD